MDIGKIKGNFSFYEGYEGEPQVSIAIKDDEIVHIHLWDGYFDDIFGNPTLDGTGWTGFTRDYNQLEGAFAENADCYEIMPEEYLNDLSSYRGKAFDYEETADVVDLICELLQYAIDIGKPVVVTKD